MQEKIYLGVKNHHTGESYIASCTLPVRIGRQHDVGNQVLLDPIDPRRPTISRVHGVIEKSPRGLIFHDQSQSGSRVGGLNVHNARVSLGQQFTVDIENYTITQVKVTNPFAVLETNPELVELGRLELLAGRGIGIMGSPDGWRLINLNHWTEWDKPLAARFELSDETPVLVIEDPAIAPRRNKAAIAADRTPLAVLDVIEIDRYRFEIGRPHEPSVVCGWEHCHLLNPPPIAANCRFCGHDLANSDSFSRRLK